MSADGERAKTQKRRANCFSIKRGPNPGKPSVFICVHLGPSAIEMNGSGLEPENVGRLVFGLIDFGQHFQHRRQLPAAVNSPPGSLVIAKGRAAKSLAPHQGDGALPCIQVHFHNCSLFSNIWPARPPFFAKRLMGIVETADGAGVCLADRVRPSSGAATLGPVNTN